MNQTVAYSGAGNSITVSEVSRSFVFPFLSKYATIRVAVSCPTAGGTVVLKWSTPNSPLTFIDDEFAFSPGVAFSVQVVARSPTVDIVVTKTSGVTTDPAEVYICVQRN